MSRGAVLPTKIEELSNRVDRIRVFEEHWRLISKNLIQLRRALTDKSTTKEIADTKEKIALTMEHIEQVAAICSTDQSTWKRIDYRRLESALLHLQFRLAQYQTNVRENYQAQVNILTETYHDQHFLLKKAYDEKMAKNIDNKEQYTAEQNKEKVNQLYEKHGQIIQAYLRGCMDLYKTVSVNGLKGDIVCRVAKNFYGISPETQNELEQKWQACDIPLIRTFIRMRFNESTSLERSASRRLLSGVELNLVQISDNRKQVMQELSEKIVSAPHMLSLIVNNRYAHGNNDAAGFESILRTDRWIVVLGGPGSGKTCSVRWLVLHLAKMLLSNKRYNRDLGPVRVPILIRIREFAEILSQVPSLTLFDYIGQHTWMGKTIINDPLISLETLASTLQDYIKQGQALIILDGLDEISSPDQRLRIVHLVEDFAETYVQTPDGQSVFDDLHWQRYVDDPYEYGGNQLLITSRTVGYHAAPLIGHFTHYTIQPVDKKNLKDYVDYWFHNVHEKIIDTLKLFKSNQGIKHGETLKNELEREKNIALRDLTSNCYLMSFICCLAVDPSTASSITASRIEFYQNIINLMLNSFIANTPSITNTSKLSPMLSDLAIYIQKNSLHRLITEDKMREICKQYTNVDVKRNMNEEEEQEEDFFMPKIEPSVVDFPRIFREDIGILTAQGESVYGFINIRLQEYFICLQLTNVDKFDEENLFFEDISVQSKANIAIEALSPYITDPRFQVTEALALGKISSRWSTNEFDEFCRKYIQADQEANSLLPVGSLMLVDSNSDLVNYPSIDILLDAIDQLIIAAGSHRWSRFCPFLFDRITTALTRLPPTIVPQWINRLLTQSPLPNIETISALCKILEGKPCDFENIKWLDESSCSILESFAKLDSENNQFAVDRVLLKIAFSKHKLLSMHPNTLKDFLITQKIQLKSIPIFLLPVIITLYGGLKRDGQSVVFDPLYIYRESTVVTPILIHYLTKVDHFKGDKMLIKIQEDFLKTLLEQIEANNQSSDTVDLCIATICLYGIDFVQKNEKTVSNMLFNACISRLKYVSMVLRQFYFANNEDDHSIENEITKFISNVLKQTRLDQWSKKHFLGFLDSLRSGLARLRSSSTSILLKGKSKPDTRMTLNLPASLHRQYAYLMRLLTTDMKFKRGQNACSSLHSFIKLFWILEHDDECDTTYRMGVAMDDIPEYLLLYHDEDLLFPLVFVPEHLRNLYCKLIEKKLFMIHLNDWQANSKDYLFYSHILIECFLLLSNASCDKFALLSALIALLPLLRIYRLENFASTLLWTLAKQDSYILEGFENSKQHPMNDETGLYFDLIEDFLPGADISDDERQKFVKQCIKQEHKRFRNALIENDANSTKLYSACISLARVARWDQKERKLHLLEESIRGAMLIESKLVRLDALSVILLYSNSEYHRIKVNTGRSLQKEIEHQFNDVFPDLPVLLHTAIFIRCLPLLQRQESVENCRKNLLDKFANADLQDQLIAYEALLPYLQSNSSFLPFQQHILNQTAKQNNTDLNRKTSNYSSVLKECFTQDPYTILLNESLPLSLALSNMYISELTSELHTRIGTNSDLLQESSNAATARDEAVMIMRLFQFKSPVLRVAQATAITDILSSTLASNRWKYTKKFWAYLNSSLHFLTSIEFKACRLIECWMRWKESNELSLFAFHAALLLVQTDFWSVEAANIICDLLCSENDRFRQKAEMTLRSAMNHNLRTSGKLDIDVILTLAKKMARFQHISPFAKLTLSVMFDSITIDVRSHLETFLWLERYRIYALMSKKNSLNKFTAEPISQYAAYYPSDNDIDVSICGPIRNISGNLLRYMCELIQSNFSSFLEIDGDITSKLVLESHIQFIVSVLVSLATLSAYDDETRTLRIDALLTLIETSTKYEIRQAAVYAVGYILDTENYKRLFTKLQILVKKAEIESNEDLERLISALIGSYCHFISIYGMDFDQDDMDFFQLLLAHPSPTVLKAVHVGLARVLKEKSVLFEMLDFNYIECFHALMAATAYFFGYAVQHRCADQVVEFIVEHPNLLSLFVLELYGNTRQFTNEVIYRETTDNILAYGYPQYVEVASLIVLRMPAAFISCVQDSGFEADLKRAIFCTSKQHDFSRRISCLTILSIFGEMTVELCEMFIEAFCHDSLIRNRCYQCLAFLTSIIDEDAVQSRLFSYLKSKSMTIRYSAAKVLLHLVQSCLIPFAKVRPALDELISDPNSEEDLYLEKEQTHYVTECSYYYVGTLKDAVHSLLVQHITGDKNRVVHLNELNDIDADFLQSEKVSNLASCLYVERTEKEHQEIQKSLTPCEAFDDEEDSDSKCSTPTNEPTNDNVSDWHYKKKEDDNRVQSLKIEDPPANQIASSTMMNEKTEDETARASVIKVDVGGSQTTSRTSAPEEKKSGLCTIL